MPAASSSLRLFDPVIRGWFEERLGQPTEIQDRAWPEIAAGRHVLVTAPTGSGKTLTAFLWALDRLLTGAWAEGKTRVLYVSPLKALNTDIRRNLEQPLAEIQARLRAAGRPSPGIQAATRSGDTPQNERQRMLRHPPEILITTPESLNILLTSRGGRSLLDGLETVILDEIHAVAGSKRGTHLMTAVERLTRLGGEFQRLALSATVRPLDRIARFVGGSEVEWVDGGARHHPRDVRVVRSSEHKVYDLRVCNPGQAPSVDAGGDDELAGADEASLWPRLVPRLREAIRHNRSTLLFVNNRRLTERLARMINEERADVAYAHHGSLSKEVRAVVEERFKAGELSALVATSSLELGIDIGDLEEVLLIQSPWSVAATVQRVGRAGHRVGEVSRGRLYPTFGRDFLQAAVLTRAVLDGEIEEVHPVRAPLDVLAQVVLSMVVAETWPVDELYDFLRGCDSYRDLSRRQFDLVLEMLAGRYADTRLRELKPRVALDKVAGTVRARPGVARLLYMAGGTIPDRGYYTLRVHDSMAKLGELDEEFVWERSVGDVFSFGAQSWRVRKITHNDVLVAPARSAAGLAPFWRADEGDRGSFLSDKVARFVAAAEDRLEEPGLLDELEETYRVEREAAEELVAFLISQKAEGGGKLPHRHRLVIERVGERGREGDRRQVILHTLWGGTVNRPLALALAAAWEERHPGEPVEVHQDNDCIALVLPNDADAEDLLPLPAPEQVEDLLRGRLESTGFFGAHFRQNAGRSLLLPKTGFRQRTPLWLHRQRSKKLLEGVARYGDFPVVVETWRTCLRDAFELEALKERLEEVRDGRIAVEVVHTASPSPFAAGLVWKQTNQLMYADDTPEGRPGGALQGELLRELVRAGGHRPAVAERLVRELESKLQRLAPGYAPSEAAEIVEWLKERLILSAEEWDALLSAVAGDAGPDDPFDRRRLVEELESRAVRIDLPGAAPGAVVAIEALPRLAAAVDLPLASLPVRPLDGSSARLAMETVRAIERIASVSEQAPLEEGEPGGGEGHPATGLVMEWARFHGPFPEEALAARFGWDAARRAEILAPLLETETLVADALIAERAEVLLCDGENLETLLRWSRAAARPVFEALPLESLPLFLASWQGLAEPGAGLDDLRDRLDRLLLFPAPAAAWEAEILPARLRPYYPSWLDSLLQESELLWRGAGKERLLWTFPGDLDLVHDGSEDGGSEGGESPTPDEAPVAGETPIAWEEVLAEGVALPSTELALRLGLPSDELGGRLWREAWRGRLTQEGFTELRRAALARFREPATVSPGRGAPAGGSALRPRGGQRAGGRRHQRWRPTLPPGSRWLTLPTPEGPLDALDRDELAKERARLLLARYGILFRQILSRELPVFQWSRIFRALRILELSGEVLAGYFFDGIPGPQFIAPAAFRGLREGLPEDAIYWLNATDPASPCGLDLEGLKGNLPRRHATTHLAFVGSRLAATSQRSGRALRIELAPDDERLDAVLGFLDHLLTREFDPMKQVEVETINDEPAGSSPYLERLRARFSLTREARSIRLRRRYGAGAGG